MRLLQPELRLLSQRTFSLYDAIALWGILICVTVLELDLIQCQLYAFIFSLDSLLSTSRMIEIH